MHWYLYVLKNYAEFAGRAQRAEYWQFALIHVLISIALGVLQAVLATTAHVFLPVATLYALAVLIPGLAVTARRLHDIGRSGWWQLIYFIPIIGLIVMLVWLVKDSQPGENRFGPNPKGIAGDSPTAGETAEPAQG